MNMNVKMNNKAKTSRLVVAKQMSNLDKIFVVQLKYYLNNKSRVIDDANEIEISSVNGLIDYEIHKIEHEEKKIIFLYGSSPYVIELKN